MDNCPISNNPCSNIKNIHYHINDGSNIKDCNICQNCIGFIDIKDLVFTSCSNCGLLLMDLQNNGKMGCSNCYIQFKLFVDKILKKCQQSLTHCGKRPLCFYDITIEKIEKIMMSAIVVENYELAKKCKDAIIRKAKTLDPLDQ